MIIASSRPSRASKLPSSTEPGDLQQDVQSHHGTLGAALVGLAILTLAGPVTPASASATPLSEWAAAKGYALDPVADHMTLVTSLAAVAEPGPDASDPKLFIAELRGDIKVLTNDDSVHLVASVPTVGNQSLALQDTDQQGLTGICLDPGTGYVFVTYAKPDGSGILRNHLVRFAFAPRTFAGDAGPAAELATALQHAQSSQSHQIGNCTVSHGRVFIGVGDGGNAAAAGRPDVLLGKVVCVTLDGEPCSDAPFVDAPTASGTVNGTAATAKRSVADEAYVWATGFRNPFGIQAVGDDLFVAQNGQAVDTIVRVRRGQDHLWAGQDAGPMAVARLAIYPAVSPVQLGYVAAEHPWAGPEQRDALVMAIFGGHGANTGLVEVPPEDADPTVPNRYLLEYVGDGEQHVGAVAAAIDGLYTAPMLPRPDGTTPLLRLAYAPAHMHLPSVEVRTGLVSEKNEGLLQAHGCVSCHSVNGLGGGIGPALDGIGMRYRLTRRLNAPGYAQQVAAVDKRTDEPYVSYRHARQLVLKAHGEGRTWVWMKYYLQEPRFDNPTVAMPNLGLTEAEAKAIRAEMVTTIGGFGPSGWPAFERYVAEVWSVHRKALLLGAFAGVVATLLLLQISTGLLRRRA